jgi:RHS repeat-associated protein
VRGDDLLAVMRPLADLPGSAADWQTRFYHSDHIGSVRRLTNEAGQVTDGYTYSAFGERITHTGSDPQPYAFTGEPYDPNVGFQYHRARWMEPRAGRFLGMDPFEGLRAFTSTSTAPQIQATEWIPRASSKALVKP